MEKRMERWRTDGEKRRDEEKAHRIQEGGGRGIHRDTGSKGAGKGEKERERELGGMEDGEGGSKEGWEIPKEGARKNGRWRRQGGRAAPRGRAGVPSSRTLGSALTRYSAPLLVRPTCDASNSVCDMRPRSVLAVRSNSRTVPSGTASDRSTSAVTLPDVGGTCTTSASPAWRGGGEMMVVRWSW
eukprot:356865-Chlamydomonas_euryale.AAC.5